MDPRIDNIGRVLLMKTQYRSQSGRLLHGASCHILFQQRYPVIGKTCRPCRQQLFHISQLPALLPSGHSTAAFHTYPCFPSFLQYIGKDLRIVHSRSGIGHQHHCSKSAFCGCSAAAFYILLVEKARIPEMHMYIHKPWRHRQPGGIKDLHLAIRL